jgi:acyl-coenzyme A thioesterase PaaI-like protein
MDTFMEQVQSILEKHPALQIPPKVFEGMDAEVVRHIKNKSLAIRLPAKEWYAGPTGFMQGGMIAAAFDNAFGPFSYLVARRPCVTQSLDVRYMRPVPAGSGFLEVEVSLVAKTRTTLFLEGRALIGGSKLAATASTVMAVLREPSARAGNGNGVET